MPKLQGGNEGFLERGAEGCVQLEQNDCAGYIIVFFSSVYSKPHEDSIFVGLFRGKMSDLD